jgi:ADP-ribose pyrophosphatase YjhB (NUDIX family)
MKRLRDTYCSFCGTAYAPPLAYPRTCPNGACAVEIWANPIPVVVILLPIRQGGREGLLVVRRGIEPARGRLALVGGFLEEHESWQVGMAREVREEVGVHVDPASVEPYWFASSAPRPNHLLLFGTAPAQDASALPAFVRNDETEERGVVFGPKGIRDVFVFPLHIEAAERWFAARGNDDAHGYVTL